MAQLVETINWSPFFLAWELKGRFPAIFDDPEARDFALDRITKDQVEAYACRKGMTRQEAERWLSPNLGYEP